MGECHDKHGVNWTFHLIINQLILPHTENASNKMLLIPGNDILFYISRSALLLQETVYFTHCYLHIAEIRV